MRKAQKAITLLLAAAGAVVLVLAATVAWPEIHTRYHLARLRARPARLSEMIESGSAARKAAITRFVKEPPGRQALFEHYLREFFLGGEVGRTQAFRRLDKGGEGILGHSHQRPVFITWDSRGRLHRGIEATVVPGMGNSSAVLDLLCACLGHTFSYPGLEHVEFQVLPVGDEIAIGQTIWADGKKAPEPEFARALLSSLVRYGDPSNPASRFICFVRVRPEGHTGGTSGLPTSPRKP